MTFINNDLGCKGFLKIELFITNLFIKSICYEIIELLLISK